MPLVDVQNTQQQVVVNRDLMDAVPTARNYSGMAALMPGVRMSNTDVGGNQQMEQIYMTVNGSRQTDTTVQVDGMNLNSLMNDGQVQAYFSDAAMAEIDLPDERHHRRRLDRRRPHQHDPEGRRQHLQRAGVRRRHRRRLAGEQRHRRAAGARAARTGSRVAKIADVNFGVGGPIMKDKLWFFASWRRIATDSVIPGSYFANTGEVGTGVEDQWIQNNMVRLTWQVNQKNKFSVYHDRYPKFKGHEVDRRRRRRMGHRGRPPRSRNTRSTTPARRSGPRRSAASCCSKPAISTNVEYLYIGYQPGVQKERNSPEWFNTDRQERRDHAAGVRRPHHAGQRHRPEGVQRHQQLSYVTGSHALKTGVNWTFGDYVLEYDINGDLVQLYRNGVPDSVRVYNTPVRANEYLNGNLGMFVQDSWTLEPHDAEHGRPLRALRRVRSRTRPSAPAASRRSAASPR